MHQSSNGVPKKPVGIQAVDNTLGFDFQTANERSTNSYKNHHFYCNLDFFLLIAIYNDREKEQRKWSHERVTNTHFFVNLAHSSVYVHFLLFFGVKNTTHSKYNKGCMYSLHKCTSILVTFQVDLYWVSVVVLLTFLRRTMGRRRKRAFSYGLLI